MGTLNGPVKQLSNSELSQSRAYTFIDSYIYMRNRRYNALYEKNKEILKIEANAIRNQSAEMLYNAFIEQSRILDSAISRIRQFALYTRNDVINNVSELFPERDDVNKYNTYLKNNSPVLKFIEYKIEPIKYNDMTIFFNKAISELKTMVNTDSSVANINNPILHQQGSDYLLNKAIGYVDYKYGLLSMENIKMIRLQDLVKLNKMYIKESYISSKIQKSFVMFDNYLKSYKYLQNMVDALKPTVYDDRILLKSVSQKSISFNDYLVIYKHFVNMIKYMVDIVSYYESKFFNKIYAIESNIEMYNSLLISGINELKKDTMTESNIGLYHNDDPGLFNMINGNHQAQMMLYDNCDDIKTINIKNLYPDDEIVPVDVIDISDDKNKNKETFMDVVTDCERSINESTLSLKSMHPIDIFNINFESLNEAVSVKTYKKLMEFIIKANDKFRKVSVEFKKANVDWIRQSKGKDNGKDPGEFETYPYWDGFSVLEKIELPPMNTAEQEIGLLLNNNGIGFKQKYFPKELFKDDGTINKTYFRCGKDIDEEKAKMKINKTNVGQYYDKALKILESQDSVSNKIYSENLELLNALKKIKTVKMNESYALSMSEFKDEYYSLLLEADDNGYEVNSGDNSNASTDATKDTAIATTPADIENKIDRKDKTVNKDDADKNKNANDSNLAIFKYVEICYGIQSARMGVIDEALGNCIKFIQRVRK